jgi:hypothetical protein
MARSDLANETELQESGHAVIQTNLFCNLAVVDSKHRCSGKPHLSGRSRRQRPDPPIHAPTAAPGAFFSCRSSIKNGPRSVPALAEIR